MAKRLDEVELSGIDGSIVGPGRLGVHYMLGSESTLIVCRHAHSSKISV